MAMRLVNSGIGLFIPNSKYWIAHDGMGFTLY